MPARRLSGPALSRPGAAGFTLVELALTLVMLGILAAVMVPRVANLFQRSGSRQAAGVLATELESAVALAARFRVPVRVSCDCPNGVLLFTNRNTGEVLNRRILGGQGSGFYVQTMALAPATVDVFPNGVTSGPLTVTLGTPVGTRQVTMSTAGFVRVVP